MWPKFSMIAYSVSTAAAAAAAGVACYGERGRLVKDPSFLPLSLLELFACVFAARALPQRSGGITRLTR